MTQDERDAPAPKTSCCIPEVIGCLLPASAVVVVLLAGGLARKRRRP